TFCLFLIFWPSPSFTLFPYTTLFRSDPGVHALTEGAGDVRDEDARGAGRADAQRPRGGRRRDRDRRCPAHGYRVRVEHGCASARSEEHTSELQSLAYLVCRLLLEKKK